MFITFLELWHYYTDNFLGIIPSFTFSGVIISKINVPVCGYLYLWAILSFWLAVGGWRLAVGGWRLAKDCHIVLSLTVSKKWCQ